MVRGREPIVVVVSIVIAAVVAIRRHIVEPINTLSGSQTLQVSKPNMRREVSLIHTKMLERKKSNKKACGP